MSVKKLFDLAGKTALITGGSRGLGLQMAEGGRDPVSRSAGAGAHAMGFGNESCDHYHRQRGASV
jgi:NAD(P)-dependent dehydrogenase (short-subunit alcohol dehydrogenase family)